MGRCVELFDYEWIIGYYYNTLILPNQQFFKSIQTILIAKTWNSGNQSHIFSAQPMLYTNGFCREI